MKKKNKNGGPAASDDSLTQLGVFGVLVLLEAAPSPLVCADARSLPLPEFATFFFRVSSTFPNKGEDSDSLFQAVF